MAPRMNHDRKSEGIRPIKAVVLALQVVAFRKIEVPSIPFAGDEIWKGRCRDGRTRNILDPLSRISPLDQHPRALEYTSNSRVEGHPRWLKREKIEPPPF